MLRKRLVVAAILLPIGMFAVAMGGNLFYALLIIFLLGGVWEFSQLFSKADYKSTTALMLLSVFAIAITRAFWEFENSHLIIGIIILIVATFHLISYERGRDQAGTDFAISIAGIVYIGWLGGYLISVRNLENGKWWFLTVLFAIILADTGAYAFGKLYGKHKLAPRLSPKKTWEGYIAGILVGTIGTALLTLLWKQLASEDPSITPLMGALLGFIISLIAPLGDLVESMIKRQVGSKDSGNTLPGHGGFFDRIDSWLWAGIIGYYFVTLILPRFM